MRILGRAEEGEEVPGESADGAIFLNLLAENVSARGRTMARRVFKEGWKSMRGARLCIEFEG